MSRKHSNRKHSQGKMRNYQKLVSQGPLAAFNRHTIERFEALPREMRNRVYRVLVGLNKDALITTEIDGGFHVYDKPDMVANLERLRAFGDQTGREAEDVFYEYNTFALAFPLRNVTLLDKTPEKSPPIFRTERVWHLKLIGSPNICLERPERPIPGLHTTHPSQIIPSSDDLSGAVTAAIHTLPELSKATIAWTVREGWEPDTSNSWVLLIKGMETPLQFRQRMDDMKRRVWLEVGPATRVWGRRQGLSRVLLQNIGQAWFL